MKRAAAAILGILVGTFGVQAFASSIDFGGSVLNTTGVGNYPTISVPNSPPGLLQRDAASLWLQAALSDDITATAQIGTMFAMDQYSSRPIFFFIDADLFNFAGSAKPLGPGPQLFRYSFGRMVFSDFTGFVLNHKADGFMLGLEFPLFSAGISAGYTGLVGKGGSSIAISRSDVNDVVNPAVSFAPPRLVETVRLRFLDIMGQKLTISGVLQQDLRDTYMDLATNAVGDLITEGTTSFNPLLGGPVNTEYVGAGLDGTIVSTLTYSLYGYLGIMHDLVYTDGSYQRSLGYSALAGGGVGYFIESALFSRIGAKLLFASGDAGAVSVYESNTRELTLFLPISRAPLGYVFSPQMSNIVRMEASYSLKPLSALPGDFGRNLDATLKADVYLRPTAGAISESGIPSGNAEPYLGTETDFTVNFRPFSDLGITLWGGLFFPGGAFGDAPALQYRAGLDVSLSF